MLQNADSLLFPWDVALWYQDNKRRRRCRGPKGPRTAPERHLGLIFIVCCQDNAPSRSSLSLLKLKELKPKAVSVMPLLAMLLVLIPMPVLLLMLMLAMAMQVLAVFALMPEMPGLVLQAVLAAMIFEQDVTLG